MINEKRIETIKIVKTAKCDNVRCGIEKEITIDGLLPNDWIGIEGYSRVFAAENYDTLETLKEGQCFCCWECFCSYTCRGSR